MARYTRKARNTSGNNRHSNANTQFSNGVHSGRRDMHDANSGGMGMGNTVQGMQMCGGTGQNAMGSCPPGMVCTHGVCMLPEITVTPRGASQSYRRGGRVNRKFKPVRSNPRRRR